MKRHVIIGAVAAVLLIGIYLSILTLAQGLTHALEQTVNLWYWVLALATGFGVQVGLFSFIRHSLKQGKKSAIASVATSGGVSAGSMAACCAHHLADIAPFLGLSGIAIFATRYQTFFIVIGVLSNIIGVIVMLETIQRHGLSDRLSRWSWNLGWVKKGAIVVAALTALLIFLLSS